MFDGDGFSVRNHGRQIFHGHKTSAAVIFVRMYEPVNARLRGKNALRTSALRRKTRKIDFRRNFYLYAALMLDQGSLHARLPVLLLPLHAFKEPLE